MFSENKITIENKNTCHYLKFLDIYPLDLMLIDVSDSPLLFFPFNYLIYERIFTLGNIKLCPRTIAPLNIEINESLCEKLFA